MSRSPCLECVRGDTESILEAKRQEIVMQNVQTMPFLRWVRSAVGAMCLLGLNAWAAGPALDVATVGQAPVSLRPYFAVMEDPGAAMVLADVQSDAVASRFAPGAGRSYRARQQVQTIYRRSQSRGQSQSR